jgi:hypothetical protein
VTPDALAGLRDIHLPPPPDGGLGGWLLALLALALAGLGLWLARRRHRLLRAALGELERLAAEHARSGDATPLARGLSQLLRRYALVRFPTQPVAGLTGSDWLRFLDAHGGGGAFHDGPGAVLASLPYAPAGAADGAALIALVRRWLQANPT